jgi:hypothetical protein
MTTVPVASVLGDFIIGSILVLFYFAVIFTWFFSMFDLFARGDLSGWMKAFWLVAIIIFPLLGVLVYFIVRPKDARWWVPGGHAEHEYSRDWEIGEIETLIRLRNQGTITEDEFTRMKQKVLAA